MTISNINGSFLAFSIPRFSFSRPSFQTSDSPPSFPVTRLSLRRCRPAVMRHLDIWRAAAQAGGQSGAIRIIRENRNPESQQEAPFANIRGASSSSREAGRRRRPGAQSQSQLAQRRSVQRNGSKPSFALLSPRGNILRLTCAWHGGVADRICQFDLFLTFFFLERGCCQIQLCALGHGLTAVRSFWYKTVRNLPFWVVIGRGRVTMRLLECPQKSSWGQAGREQVSRGPRRLWQVLLCWSRSHRRAPFRSAAVGQSCPGRTRSLPGQEAIC